MASENNIDASFMQIWEHLLAHLRLGQCIGPVFLHNVVD